MSDKVHTILLVQPNRRPESRTYGDFEHVDDALEGVCKFYEEQLKRQNPHHEQITYDISQLFDFVDSLTDLVILVFRKSSESYEPQNKDWIKEKIYHLLKKQAGGN
ncbi:unnamed protein product [Oikopleura dioica]|uniref:Enhancer of rudimentary homolog n=1 Tax=Oikopleura dioica TaxID=34765 RepID=E4XQY6_OIKDI|nr:unnamed protein product [Oikopleura dioica]